LAFTLAVKDGSLVQNEIPRGGIPTPEAPPGRYPPSVRLAFYDPDNVIDLDEPGKGALGDFLRNKKGRLAFSALVGGCIQNLNLKMDRPHLKSGPFCSLTFCTTSRRFT